MKTEVYLEDADGNAHSFNIPSGISMLVFDPEFRDRPHMEKKMKVKAIRLYIDRFGNTAVTFKDKNGEIQRYGS